MTSRTSVTPPTELGALIMRAASAFRLVRPT